MEYNRRLSIFGGHFEYFVVDVNATHCGYSGKFLLNSTKTEIVDKKTDKYQRKQETEKYRLRMTNLLNIKMDENDDSFCLGITSSDSGVSPRYSKVTRSNPAQSSALELYEVAGGVTIN